MCLIVIAIDAHPRRPFVVAANRDEYRGRPAAPAAFWKDQPALLAGRDLEAGGTWLGITRGGRFAAVTNFREGAAPAPGAPSRGELVTGFLTGRASAREHLALLRPRADDYGGFSLLAGVVGGDFACFSNRGGGEVAVLDAGLYGMSNHLLETPWPKVVRAKDALAKILDRDPAPAAATLLEMLGDATPPESAGRRERTLGAIFVNGPEYGTRCSTVILTDDTNRTVFVERSYNGDGRPAGDARFLFQLEREG